MTCVDSGCSQGTHVDDFDVLDIRIAQRITGVINSDIQHVLASAAVNDVRSGQRGVGSADIAIDDIVTRSTDDIVHTCSERCSLPAPGPGFIGLCHLSSVCHRPGNDHAFLPNGQKMRVRRHDYDAFIRSYFPVWRGGGDMPRMRLPASGSPPCPLGTMLRLLPAQAPLRPPRPTTTTVLGRRPWRSSSGRPSSCWPRTCTRPSTGRSPRSSWTRNCRPSACRMARPAVGGCMPTGWCGCAIGPVPMPGFWSTCTLVPVAGSLGRTGIAGAHEPVCGGGHGAAAGRAVPGRDAAGGAGGIPGADAVRVRLWP
ncbi:hypothetical protein BN940_00021 [Castellaniella defragrans 65Phen]|uniref:Uncharacterized protein n=1 Tax=Castellaniella defragrans (strain DSM 12143 / CCUG 39792 / 65Phen) TaxID=1437824 RepID=W8X855_CASD6|nr:hypothetical protein BN940_00021 [Castellaniella defragrans 65Phen]